MASALLVVFTPVAPATTLSGSSAATEWTSATTAPLTTPGGLFRGISCAEDGTCMAVGQIADGYFQPPYAVRSRPFAEQLTADGAVVEPTGPPAVTDGMFTAVSCASSSICVAVGTGYRSPLIEVWDGKTWSRMTAPALHDAAAQLNGVSCPTPTSCVAVGVAIDLHTDGAGTQWRHQLVETWDGTAWQGHVLPGTHNSSLGGVSCVSADRCIAVGDTMGFGGISEVWDGADWTAQPVPHLADGSGALTAVSCTTETSCVAVGHDPDVSDSVADHWNGRRWAVINKGLRPPRFVKLDGVSCPSAQSCEAVGSAYSTVPREARNGIVHPIAYHWDGDTWVKRSSEVPSTDVSTFAAVDCDAKADCTAVGRGGSLTTEFDVAHPVAERLTGPDWTLRPVTDGEARVSSTVFSAVSCPAATSCTAVGRSDNAQYGNADLLPGIPVSYRRTGGGWRRLSVPDGAGSLTSVSCPNPTFCVAVGRRRLRHSVAPLVAQKSHGEEWQTSGLPLPAGLRYLDLSSVSCTSRSWCVAAGTAAYSPSAGEPERRLPAYARWDGTHWHVGTLPSPNGADSVGVTGVSCSSRHHCAVVGAVNDWSVSGETGSALYLALRNGRAWREGSIALPPGADGGELTAVSCAQGFACMAVGRVVYLSESESFQPFAASRGEFGRWTATYSGDASDAFPAPATSVSCRSATDCLAVGAFSQPYPAPSRPMLDHWDGTHWSQEPAPATQPDSAPQLSGVSCAAETSCTAVGSEIIDHIQRPLIEQQK
jgi:hypothetical protein